MPPERAPLSFSILEPYLYARSIGLSQLLCHLDLGPGGVRMVQARLTSAHPTTSIQELFFRSSFVGLRPLQVYELASPMLGLVASPTHLWRRDPLMRNLEGHETSSFLLPRPKGKRCGKQIVSYELHITRIDPSKKVTVRRGVDIKRGQGAYFTKRSSP